MFAEKKICRKKYSEKKKLCLKNIFTGKYKIRQKKRLKQGQGKMKAKQAQPQPQLQFNGF